MKPSKGKLVIELSTAHSGTRLDKAIAQSLPDYSRGQIQRWLKNGNIIIDKETAKPKAKVVGGERIIIHTDDDGDSSIFKPEKIPLNVVFEDENILVLNKPAGLVMHPGNGNPSGTLLNALLEYSSSQANIPRAGIVHRLDKETSGILVVAKTLLAQSSLVKQLQARTLTREYHAIVWGQLKNSGTIDAPVGRHPKTRTKMAITPRGKPAKTNYTPLKIGMTRTLVRCRLESGRTHQIRVHLTHIGHPIVGDPIYKQRSRKSAFPRQALNACKLALRHPSLGLPMEWEITMPSDMKNLLSDL